MSASFDVASNRGIPQAQAAAWAPARAMPGFASFYWSVRREIWENRSIYLGLVVVGGLVLFAFGIGLLRLGSNLPKLMDFDPAKRSQVLAMPFSAVASIVLLASFLIGVFYCLEALHGERRDRSILFWKSLPVSDATSVLAKLSVPLLVLPAVSFVVVLLTQAIMLLMSVLTLTVHGMSAAPLRTELPLFRMAVTLAYGLVVMALWHAPLYAWFLLVSGWAKKAVLLWAVIPPLAVCMVEKIAFHTDYCIHLLGWRFVGGILLAFGGVHHGDNGFGPLSSLTPGLFLAGRGLWLGLLVAAALLYAAIHQRRERDPI